MGLHAVPLLAFNFFTGRPVKIDVAHHPLSCYSRLLPITQFDHTIELTQLFADALSDRRQNTLVRQSLLSMVRQQIYGTLADHEDQNDHDSLRSNPVFKLIANRFPKGPDRASQPTLWRFENAITIPDLWRLRDVLVDLFIQTFDTLPSYLTLDMDGFDDPDRGQQKLITMNYSY